MSVPDEGARQVPSSVEIPKREVRSSCQDLGESLSGQRLALTNLMDPGDFSARSRPQLVLHLYINPKKPQQGLLHGHCHYWAAVQHSHSTWENKRTRHLASYTALWALEQGRKGMGKPLGVGEQLAFIMVF